MDCRGDDLIQHNNRTAAQAVPFQYLINEQAKSILALQELQNEVGALLEFRDMVMDTFPHLRHKQASSPEPSSGSQGVGSGESRWEPGVRVRRKLQGSSSGWIAGAGGGGAGGSGVGLAAAAGTAPRSRSNSHGKGPKSGEPAAASSVGTVQDSGFCTESKDSSSTSSRTTMTTKNCGKDDDEDELWSLLEMIQDKGTKLKLEVESLQNRLLVDDERLRRRRRRLRLRPCRSVDDLLHPGTRDGDDLRSTQCSGATTEYDVFRAHVATVKRERDALLDRVTEMEAESLSNAAQIHRLLTELKTVVCENRELEERLCGGKSPSAAAAIAAATIAARKSSSSHNGGGFAPVQPESSTGPSSSSAGRDAFYTPSQHSACNLSSIELQCSKLLHDGSSSASCASLSSSSAMMDDDGGGDRDRHRSRRVLMVRPSDPISRNLEGRASSPALDIGSPTFAKRLGALDGVVSSPSDRINKPHTPGFSTPLPKKTLAAILKTFNPIELQRHLITVSYENKNLVRQMEMLNVSKNDVSNELNKSKEDNEELKFQLEEKRIELEGTMARVRLLQLHQEQQQHGPIVAGSQSSGTAAAATNQWLDLVPSNPILPQIALPATPSSAVSTPHTSNNHLHHHHLNHSQDENGGSSSTESAHQTRSGRHGVQHQPSKIPVVKPSSCPVQPRPTSSYRGSDVQQYQSWTKCKSDQSLPRNWESINNNNNSNNNNSNNNKSNGGSSIGSGGGGVKQRGNKVDSSHNHLHQHRSRRDSGGGGGGTSLTRARSQNNHSHRSSPSAVAKDFNRIASAGHQLQLLQQQPAADDTNKVRPTKRFTNMFNSWMRKS